MQSTVRQNTNTPFSRFSIHKVTHFINSTHASLTERIKKITYFVPGMSLNLRELEFRVVWVHALDFLPCWGAQNLGNQNIRHVTNGMRTNTFILNAINMGS
jgi:hypothetical protein